MISLFQQKMNKKIIKLFEEITNSLTLHWHDLEMNSDRFCEKNINILRL